MAPGREVSQGYSVSQQNCFPYWAVPLACIAHVKWFGFWPSCNIPL